MDCPDVEVLIAFARVQGPDGKVAEHIVQCARCSNEAGLLRALIDEQAVLEPIPERLVDRVLGALPDEASIIWPSPPVPDFLPGHSTLTFAMASGMAFALPLVIGRGGFDPLVTVGAALSVGAVAALIEPRVLKLRA